MIPQYLLQSLQHWSIGLDKSGDIIKLIADTLGPDFKNYNNYRTNHPTEWVEVAYIPHW